MNGKKGRNRTIRKDRVGFGLRGMLAILLSLSLLGLPLGSPGSVSAATIPAVSVAAAGTLPITAVSGTTPTVSERLGGSDRYATAAKISQAGWPGTAEYAVLAAGMNENLVDALTAAPLAARLKAPILLTQGTELNTYAKEELTRLEVKTVYVTSGMAVITQPILDSLKEMQITVKSLGGKDRFETSVNMAKELEHLGASVSKIVVTTGANNADALSVASIAAAKGMPILLTNLSDLPPSVKTYLDGLRADVTNSYIIGGTGVVGDTVKGLLPGQVERYAGLSRYDTNLEVLKHFANELKYQATYVANGEDASMADALAGSPLAAQNVSPILLSNLELSANARDYARLNLSPKVVALGGEGVVPAKVLDDMTSSLDLAETGATKGATDAAQPEQITDNLKISADNVILKNVIADYSIYVQGDKATLSQVKVRGTVFLDPGEQGTVNLDGVSAARVVVLSGANNSIHLKNVTAGALNVASSTPVRVETSGTTSVASTVVSSAAILDAVAGSFGKVEIAKLAPAAAMPNPANPVAVEAVVELRGNFPETVTVSGQASVKAAANANIPQMNIAPESKEQKITLQGPFQTVNINKPGEVALAENAKVASTVVNSGAILNAASGSFGQVEIAKTITGGTANGSATPGKAPVIPVVELRGTFDQKVLVSGQATVKAALNANIAKVEIAPESKEQKIILDGTFAKVEVNTEAKVELSENAKVIEAVTNAKADFFIPQTAIVEKLDPKDTGTTASGGGDVNGIATAKDSTTAPVVVTPPATNLPVSGGSSGGSQPDVQTITVNAITNVSVTVGQTKSAEVSTSPTDAAVSAVSSDTTVTTVSASGHTVTVTATQKAGSATITVTAAKSGYTGGTRSFIVTVIPNKPAAFNLGAQNGSLYIGLGSFQDQYGNRIMASDLSTVYGVDLQNSKVYLTTAENTTSSVYATLGQLMTRKVGPDDPGIPQDLKTVVDLDHGGVALHVTDSDLVGILGGQGTLVSAGGATMFAGFNATNQSIVYADISGTFGGEGGVPWEIKDNCALPDLSGGQLPVTPDTTAPVLQSAVVGGNALTLTYNEALDESSVPVAEDFTVTVNSSVATVTNVAVSGTTVTLTLAAALSVGDSVTVSYTKGTNPVQDVAGNAATDLTAQPVSNSNSPLTTAPAAAAITIVNNTGAADTVTVNGLAEGDTVTVYDSATAGTTLGTGTVTTGNTTVTINSLTLNATGGSVWVSVKSTGKAESTRTEKTYVAEPSASSNPIVYVNASLSAEDSTNFKTINAAVQAVDDGGTIQVAAGTYPEMVKNYYTITNPDNTSQTVIKSFTLQGPDWTGQTTPLVHIEPMLSAIDPTLGYGHVLEAQAEGSSHPATVNLTNLWLDGSLGIADGETVSGFIRGITLGYDVNGSITGNLVTGTGDGIYVLGAGSPTVPVSVTVNNNRVEQLAYDPSTVGSALILLAAQATVSNNTFTGLSGAPLNGIKTFYTLQASITGNTFTDFGPAASIANATYGGAMVSGDAEPLGYALNLTSSTTTDSVLTITGNTFSNVQGILADDRASGNLAYADFAAANTINGSWLAYGDKTHIHWLSNTQDPDQLNYVLQDPTLTTQSTPAVYLSPGSYTMSQNLINPTITVFFGTDNGSGVSLTIPNTSVPANIQAESGVTVTIAAG